MAEVAINLEKVTTLNSNKNSDDRSTFLNPLSVLQAICHGANRNGKYLNVYTYTLCSAAPLQDHHVRQTLVHLFRFVHVSVVNGS